MEGSAQFFMVAQEIPAVTAISNNGMFVLMSKSCKESVNIRLKTGEFAVSIDESREDARLTRLHCAEVENDFVSAGEEAEDEEEVIVKN